MKANTDNAAYDVVINEEFKNATIHAELNQSDLALWNSDTDQHSLQLTHLLWNDLTVRQQKAHHLIPEKTLKRLVIQWIKYSLDMPSHCMPNASNPTSFRNLLPASPLNDVQKQINLAEQRW